METHNMRGVSRRALFGRAGLAVGGAAAITAFEALGPGQATAGVGDDYNGFVFDQGGQVFNIKNTAYGAKGDTVQATGGSVTSGSTTFTWASGNFQTTDVGKLITVQGAGASGGVLSTTIASRSSA